MKTNRELLKEVVGTPKYNELKAKLTSSIWNENVETCSRDEIFEAINHLKNLDYLKGKYAEFFMQEFDAEELKHKKSQKNENDNNDSITPISTMPTTTSTITSTTTTADRMNVEKQSQKFVIQSVYVTDITNSMHDQLAHSKTMLKAIDNAIRSHINKNMSGNAAYEAAAVAYGDYCDDQASFLQLPYTNANFFAQIEANAMSSSSNLSSSSRVLPITKPAAKAKFGRDAWLDNTTVTCQYTAFSSKNKKLLNFIDGLRLTNGGDRAEAVELALAAINDKFTWQAASPGVTVIRSVFLILDAPPHTIGEADDHYPTLDSLPSQVDLYQEVVKLKRNGIYVYPIVCNNANACTYAFASYLAAKTGGICFSLNDFNKMAELAVVNLKFDMEEAEIIVNAEDAINRRNEPVNASSLASELSQSEQYSSYVKRREQAQAANKEAKIVEISDEIKKVVEKDDNTQPASVRRKAANDAISMSASNADQKVADQKKNAPTTSFTSGSSYSHSGSRFYTEANDMSSSRSATSSASAHLSRSEQQQQQQQQQQHH